MLLAGLQFPVAGSRRDGAPGLEQRQQDLTAVGDMDRILIELHLQDLLEDEVVEGRQVVGDLTADGMVQRSAQLGDDALASPRRRAISARFAAALSAATARCSSTFW
jgi:hypothetical protein